MNDAPVGVDDEYTIDEDTSLHLVAPGLLANDYDVDGDTITLVVVTVPSHGSGSIGADGSFSYTPDADWYGTDGMTYQVFDGTDYSGIVTVTITVNPVNDAPVGVDDEYIIDEDGSLSVPAPGVLVNDYDVDGDSLSAILVSPPYGSGSFSPNGALTYNPPANWHGVTTLTYQVFDGTEYSDIVTVTITVNSVNDAPVGVDDEYTIDEDTSLHLVAPGLLANDYDVDGDAITLVVVTVPSHGSGSISADGSFSYTPHADWYGTDGMTYKVFDGTDYSDIVTVTIIVNSVNDVPVAVDDYVVTNEDTPILIDFMGNDYDVDDSFGWDYVVWAPTEINGELEIVYDHEVEPGVFRDVLRYTPNPDWYGSISTINYRISDTFGAQSSIARIYITVNPVNDAPVAVDDYVTTNEDTSVIIDFMGNDYDVDNSFTFDYASWSTLGIHGELEFLSNYEIEPGIFRLVVRYTPDPDWHGTASAITYGIKDSDGLTSTAQIFITVNSVNDPPVAVDDYVVTDEDTPVIIDFMANDYDIDSSFDWYTITRYLSELHGTSEILHNYEVSPGVFRTVISYTPDPNWHGSTSAIYYDIWDSEGAVSETAYIHITVNSVNDPPVGVDDSYTIDEDTSLELAAPGLLANDYDVDGDIITLDFQTYPQHGTWAIGSNGFFNYYPPANWHGTDSFTYRVFDGTTYSEIVTVTVTVNPVNDAPVAVDDYITTDEDTSVIIDFMANDYDIDSSFDWYTITRYLSELHGTADILHNYEVSPGVFRTVISYTPDPNWHGSTSAIYYDIRDSEGAVSATAYIHITVNSVNDAPVGVDDSYTIDEDTSLVLPAPGVLANDYDVDGDAISLDFQTYPQHGTWAIGSNGFFNYYPPANWYGTDSFTYRVYDGTEYSEVVTVTIIVNPVNDPPVAVDDYVVTDEDTPVIIDFMGNDYDVDSDFDKKVVSWYPLEIHGQWEYVWHEVEPGVFRWTIKYTPDPDWHGAITPLQYQVMDSEGAYSNTAYIHITVNPVNDAPVAS
ncbi:MAG: Ig-like domain-containing protein, partial [Candidatus Hermodarchaeota archaeon]